MYARRSCLVLLAVVGLAVLRPALAAERTPKPDPEQARQVSKLLTQFRTVKKDPVKRAAVIDEGLGLGEHVAGSMHAAVSREMQPLLKSYSGKFFQQAGKLAQKKVGSVNLDEVQALRAKVLNLQNQADFSKELIQREGDPAIKKLEAIFVVDREEVLKESEALQTERKSLGEWARCGRSVRGTSTINCPTTRINRRRSQVSRSI